MNRNLYRMVFSKARGQLMAVCETANANGKSAGATCGPTAGGFTTALATAWTPLAMAMALAWSPSARAAPTGGTVTQGSANISQSGATTTIQQQSQRAIINWQGFNVNGGETVKFVQPNADAAVLNRVTGALPSKVDGNLLGNGRVFLINPNGIVVGKDGVVNVQGGFVASTQNVGDAAFMSGGALNFAGGHEGSIQILGKVSAPGGDIVIVAPKTTIAAGAELNAGKAVNLVAASTVTLSNGVITVTPQAGDAGELNVAGTVSAAQARLSAVNNNLGALAINSSGTIRATGTQANPDGSISIVAQGQGGNVSVSGSLKASNADGSGGVIAVQGRDVTLTNASLDVSAAEAHQAGGSISLKADTVNGTVMVTDSRLNATSASGHGGKIDATGWHTGLDGHTKVDASGGAGGGQIRIGGGMHGQDSGIDNAQITYVGADVVLDASAAPEAQPDTTSAKGGKVVVWADDTTRFAGTLQAAGRGNGQGNGGGETEVSGKQTLFFAPRKIDLSGGSSDAPAGTLLLDPADITISNAPNSVISAASPFQSSGGAVSNLNIATLDAALSAADVTVSSAAGTGGNGDIRLADPFSASSAGNHTLTLSASRDINIDAALSGANLKLAFGAGRDININAATLGGYGIDWTAARDVHLNAPVSGGPSAGTNFGVQIRAAGGDVDGVGQILFGGTGSIDPVISGLILVSGKSPTNARNNSVTLGAAAAPGTIWFSSPTHNGLSVAGFGTFTFATNFSANHTLGIHANNIVVNPTVTTLVADSVALQAAFFDPTTGNANASANGWRDGQGTISLPASLSITAPGDLNLSSGLNGSNRADLVVGPGAVNIDRAPGWASANADLNSQVVLRGFGNLTLNQALRGSAMEVIAGNLNVNANLTSVANMRLEAAGYDSGATVTNAYANGGGYTSQDGLLRFAPGLMLTGQGFALYSGVDGTSAATRFGQNARVDLPTSLGFALFDPASPASNISLVGFRDIVLPANLTNANASQLYVQARNIDTRGSAGITANNLTIEAGAWTDAGTPLINRYIGRNLNGEGIVQMQPNVTIHASGIYLGSGIAPGGLRSNLSLGGLDGANPYVAELVGFNTLVLPSQPISWPYGLFARANNIVVNADIAAGWFAGPNYPFGLVAGSFDATSGLFDYGAHPGTITFNNNPVLSSGLGPIAGGTGAGQISISTGTTPGQSFSGVRFGYVNQSGVARAYSLVRIVNFDSTTLQMQNPGDALTLAGTGQPNSNFGPHELTVTQRVGATGDIIVASPIVVDTAVTLSADQGGIRAGSNIVQAPTVTLQTGATAAVNVDTDVLNAATHGGTLVVNEADNVVLGSVSSGGGSLEVNARGELTLSSNIAFTGAAGLTLRSDAATGRTIAVGDASRTLVSGDLNSLFATHDRGAFGERGGDGLGAVSLRTSGPVLVTPVFRQVVLVEAASGFTVPSTGALTYYSQSGTALAAGSVVPVGTVLTIAGTDYGGRSVLPSALDTVTHNGAPIRELASINVGGFAVQTGDANRFYNAVTGAAYQPGDFINSATQVLVKPGYQNVYMTSVVGPTGSGAAAWVVGGYATGASSAIPTYNSLGTGTAVSNVKGGVTVTAGLAATLLVDTAVVNASQAANHYGNPVAGSNDHLNLSGQYYTFTASGDATTTTALLAPTKLNQLATNGTQHSASGNGWDIGFGTGTLQTAGGDLRIFSGAAHAIDGGGAFVAGGAADLNVYTNAPATSFGYASTPADGAVQLVTGSGNLVALGYRDVTVSAGGTLTSGGNVTIGAARDLNIGASIAAADDGAKLTTLVAGNMIRTVGAATIGTTNFGNLMLIAGKGVDVDTNVATLAGSLQDVSGAQTGVLGGGAAPSGAFVVRNQGTLQIANALVNNEVNDLAFSGSTGIDYTAGASLSRSGIVTGSVNGTAGFGNIDVTVSTGRLGRSGLTMYGDVRANESDTRVTLDAEDVYNRTFSASRVVGSVIDVTARGGLINLAVAGSGATTPRVNFTQLSPVGDVTLLADGSARFSGVSDNYSQIRLGAMNGTVIVADNTSVGGVRGVTPASGPILMQSVAGDIAFEATARSNVGVLAQASGNILNAQTVHLGSGTDDSNSDHLDIATSGLVILQAGNTIGGDGVHTPNALQVWHGGSLSATSGGTTGAAGTYLTRLDTVGNTTIPGAAFVVNSGKNVDITSRASTTPNTGDLTVGGAGVTSANGGTIRLAADRHLAVQSAIVADTSGNVVLAAGLNPATGGSIVQGAGGSIASGSGEINLHAADDVSLGADLTTGTKVLVLADGGAVTHTGGVVHAGSASLQAGTGIGTGIGTSAARVATDVQQLVLASGGDQFASNAQALSLAAATSAGGRIDVQANGTLTVDAVSVTSGLTPTSGGVTTPASGGSMIGVTAQGSGAVSLTAQGAASDVVLNRDVRSTSGDVAVDAARDAVFQQNNAQIATSGTVLATTGRDIVNATGQASGTGSVDQIVAAAAVLNAGRAIGSGAIDDSLVGANNASDLNLNVTRLQANAHAGDAVLWNRGAVTLTGTSGAAGTFGLNAGGLIDQAGGASLNAANAEFDTARNAALGAVALTNSGDLTLGQVGTGNGVAGGAVDVRSASGKVVLEAGYTLGVNGDFSARASSLQLDGTLQASGNRIVNGSIVTRDGATVAEVQINGTQARVSAQGRGADYVLGAGVVAQLIAAGVTDVTIDLGNGQISHALAGLTAQAIRLDNAGNDVSGHWNVRTGRAADASARVDARGYNLSDAGGALDLGAMNVTVNAARGTAHAAGTQASTVAASANGANTAAGFDSVHGSNVSFTQTRTSGHWTVRDAYELVINSPADVTAAYVHANHDAALIAGAHSAGSLTIAGEVRTGGSLIGVGGLDVTLNAGADIAAAARIAFVADETAGTAAGAGWFRNHGAQLRSGSHDIAVYAVAGGTVPDGFNPVAGQIALGSLAGLSETQAAAHWNTTYQTQTGGSTNWAGFAADGAQYLPGAGAYGSPMLWYKKALVAVAAPPPPSPPPPIPAPAPAPAATPEPVRREAVSPPFMSGGFAIDLACQAQQNAGGAMLAGGSHVFYGVGTPTFLNQDERRFGAAHGVRDELARPMPACPRPAAESSAGEPMAVLPAPASMQAAVAVDAPAPAPGAASTPAPRLSVSLAGELLFGFDASSVESLLPGGRALLDRLAARLVAEGTPLQSVRVTGHTDRLGSPAHNRTLSLRRAQSVLAYLAARGVQAPTMAAAGAGSAHPVAACTGVSGAALVACLQPNRRVALDAQ